MRAMAQSERETCLVSNGPVDDPATFSGTPYFFWRAARAQGRAVLPTNCRAFGTAPRRFVWTVKDRLAGRAPGGFLSKCFTRLTALDLAWRTLLPLCRGRRVLNFHPIYADAARRDSTITRWSYIDQTLMQLGDYQPDFDLAHPAFAPVLAAERASYASCAGLFAMSERARRSMIESYGVPPEKVAVLLPGVNVLREDIERARRAPRTAGGDFRLVFVGRDWRRKGLPLLVDAVARLRAAGRAVDVVVVGPRPGELPAAWRRREWIDVTGPLRKTPDAADFCRTVAAADLGVLLPEAEAAGIAIREYQALGLPVLVRDRGAAAEMVAEGAGRVLRGDVTADALAAAIHDLASHPEILAAHRSAVERQRNGFFWDGVVRTIFERMDAHDAVGGQGGGLSL